MKNIFSKLLIVLALAFVPVCCTERFPARHVLELPEMPDAWGSLLGEPHWQVEWVNPAGQKQKADFPPRKSIEIEIPVAWANPVTAWPWWPEHNLSVGIFKPCGAIFPFDASSGKHDERLRLSWEAGHDSIFYWELAFANSQNDSRTPANFDWPRFRELFQSGALSDAVCEDPWVVNWRSVAEKTIASGFDRRRIAAEAPNLKHFLIPAGAWYGTSPFAKPIIFEEGEPSAFPVRQEQISSGINIWISGEGILRVNGNTWRFTAWEKL